MKKKKDYTIELILLILAIALLASACSSSGNMPRVKRDCQGRKHYRHQNGFYIYSPKNMTSYAKA